MPDAPKLKPCPFCGHPSCIIEMVDHEWHANGAVRCPVCNMIGPSIKLGLYETSGTDQPWAAKAIEAWNRRAEG